MTMVQSIMMYGPDTILHGRTDRQTDMATLKLVGGAYIKIKTSHCELSEESVSLDK